MIQITKIFRFEMAHAINGYAGKCNNLHGHSYILQVTVKEKSGTDEFLPAPGFIIDFKELKKIVVDEVIDKLDHSLVLSYEYLNEHAETSGLKNVSLWPYEPTAENILLNIKYRLQEKLPAPITLVKLKLYETNDSYAEWIEGCN